MTALELGLRSEGTDITNPGTILRTEVYFINRRLVAMTAMPPTSPIRLS